jgi:hypothetical protein
MQKEFITYEQALELKELGFDESCFGYYEPNGELDYIENHILKDFPYLAKNSEWQDLVAAPLYQQAFRWFREKYNIISSTRTHFNEEFFYEIYVDVMNEITSDYYNTYEEAELACLNKLIEIVKDKKD